MSRAADDSACLPNERLRLNRLSALSVGLSHVNLNAHRLIYNVRSTHSQIVDIDTMQSVHLMLVQRRQLV